jgi:hypothetical protein
MEPRNALIAMLLLLALGCGDTTSVPDMSVSVDMGEAMRDFGHLGCTIPVDVTAPTMPAVAPVTLTATAKLPLAMQVKWDVQRSGDTATPLDSTDLTVSYPVTKAGTYQFHVIAQANGVGCEGKNSIDVINPIGAKVQYRLRALPSESDNLPLSDYILTVTGGQPPVANLQLMSGTTVYGTLRGPGPGNTGIPGEVRLIADNGPDALASTDAMGAFSLAVRSDGKYQPLLIPQATMLAPHLGSSDLGANFVNASFSVGAGEAVSGSVVDATNANAVIANARVVLRAGQLPSGVGITSAAGMFTLRAEQQTYGLSVGADDWPVATLSGVAVPPGGVSLGIAYSVARLTVAAKVTRADGTTPVAGARVTITAQALGNVANVSIGGAAAVPAAGHVVRQAISDNNGNLPSLLLPAGRYDLIVDPPAGTPEGLTAITKTLTTNDSWSLALQPRNTLKGTIRDGNGNGVGGVQVTALELAGLGAAPTTTSGSDGSYSLTVDAGAAMMVIFAPAPAAKLAGKKVSLAAGSTQADVVLPPGLAVTGTVTGPGGGGKGSVIVEVLCYGCDSDTPITSTITESDGSYMLYLPDPGNIIVDGGTD